MERQPLVETRGSGVICPAFRNNRPARLSINLILVGVFSVVFNCVDIALTYSTDLKDWQPLPLETIDGYNNFVTTGFVGHGIWSGVMCILAASFGLYTALRTSTKTMAFTTNVLMLVAAATSVLQFAVSVIGAWWASYYHHHYCDSYRSIACDTTYQQLIVMESILAILGVVGAVLAILSSVLWCRKVGCCSDSSSYDNI